MNFKLFSGTTVAILSSCRGEQLDLGSAPSNVPSTLLFTSVRLNSEDYILPGDKNPRRTSEIAVAKAIQTGCDACTAELAEATQFRCASGHVRSHLLEVEAPAACVLCEPPNPRVAPNAAFTCATCPAIRSDGLVDSQLFVTAAAPTLPTNYSAQSGIAAAATTSTPNRAWSAGDSVNLLPQFIMASRRTPGRATAVIAPHFLAFLPQSPKSGMRASRAAALTLTWNVPSNFDDPDERVRLVLSPVAPPSDSTDMPVAAGLSCQFPTRAGIATLPPSVLGRLPAGLVTVSAESTNSVEVRQVFSSGNGPPDIRAAEPDTWTVRYELTSTVRDESANSLDYVVLE